jgi:uncharacterized membrane protein
VRIEWSAFARSACVVVLAAIALLPLLPVMSAIWPGLSLLERAFLGWFELHCERDPARTLSLSGVPLAVCARCSGIYFGLGLGAALRWPRLSPRALRGWVLVAAALMVTDVATERTGLHSAWPALRVLTGLLLAYPVGVGVGSLVQRAFTNLPAQSP